MNQKKILLVEDDPVMAKLYADLLKKQNYQVKTAYKGEEASKILQKGGFDLVLIDIILPDINGLEVISKLKKHPPVLPNKKIIFITNLEKTIDIQMASKLGDGYLIKSNLTPEELTEKVKNYLKS